VIQSFRNNHPAPKQTTSRLHYRVITACESRDPVFSSHITAYSPETTPTKPQTASSRAATRDPVFCKIPRKLKKAEHLISPFHQFYFPPHIYRCYDPFMQGGMNDSGASIYILARKCAAMSWLPSISPRARVALICIRRFEVSLP
jgi:hypothetical protein